MTPRHTRRHSQMYILIFLSLTMLKLEKRNMTTLLSQESQPLISG